MRIFFLILISNIVASQNLVPNPSFEDYTSCPSAQTQINRVVQWNRPPNATGTPDYFNSCALSVVSVPANNYGIQEPFDGNGYVGICTYSQTTSSLNFREYIQTQLTSPLIAGQSYQVSFYVSLSENPGIATNNIGAILTVDQLAGNGTNLPINVIPQIIHPNIVVDMTNWIQISGIYLATGNESYLTIGNFFDNSQTQIQMTGGIWGQALYYIDSVSVTPLLGLQDFSQNRITIFPNPATENFSIATTIDERITSVKLYSCYNLVKCYDNVENVFDVKNLSAGIYYLHLTFESNKTIVSKLVKI